MSKGAVLLLVLAFLTASSIAVKPAFSLTDATENTWASKSPMHHARMRLGVAVANGKTFAIGGDD